MAKRKRKKRQKTVPLLVVLLLCGGIALLHGYGMLPELPADTILETVQEQLPQLSGEKLLETIRRLLPEEKSCCKSLKLCYNTEASHIDASV